MISAIESITIASAELDASLRLFRGELDLTLTSDARASVALLSAWRYPVHESVRLLELGDPTRPVGRIRLARFEDAPRPPGRTDGAADAATPAAPGPVAIDFRPPPAEGRAMLRHTPEGLALLLAGQGSGPAGEPTPSGGTPVGAATAVWILAAAGETAGRFYTEGLGYEARSTERELDEGVLAALGAPSPAGLKVTYYGAADERYGGVALVRGLESRGTAAPRRLGRPGINLLTCRCDDLDGLAKRLRALGVEPLGGPTHVSIRSGLPARVLVVRGPSEELIEFIDTSA